MFRGFLNADRPQCQTHHLAIPFKVLYFLATFFTPTTFDLTDIALIYKVNAPSAQSADECGTWTKAHRGSTCLRPTRCCRPSVCRSVAYRIDVTHFNPTAYAYWASQVSNKRRPSKTSTRESPPILTDKGVPHIVEWIKVMQLKGTPATRVCVLRRASAMVPHFNVNKLTCRTGSTRAP